MQAIDTVPATHPSRRRRALLPYAAVLLGLLCAPLALPSATAEEPAAKVGDTITWLTDLPKAFARAKEKQRVLMICINAKQVDGRAREEPAAKGLREIVYKDVRIVGKSRQFVCAYLTKGGNSADYGELRALGIEGLIVSPQHIFVHPDGERILSRKEYWSHGSGESAVKALLGMMDGALAKVQAPAPEGGGPEGGPDAPAQPDAPLGGDQPPTPEGAADEAHAKKRAAWIDKMLKQAVEAGPEDRERACYALVKHDQDGDCVKPLVALVPQQLKNVPVLITIVRALGVDQLKLATPEIVKLLKHKDRMVRGNAAVSLEYIGDKAAVKELKSRATKEKDKAIANHLYRALGRCGVGESSVRSLLLKKGDSAKDEFSSLGPIIGLGYFKGDKKAARGVEKMLGKLGIPGGRRGGFTNALKRSVLGRVLAEIGDEKSAKFVREKFLDRMENMQSRWLGALTAFYTAIVKACEGDKEAAGTIDEGIRRVLGMVQLPETLADEMRKERDTSKFEPFLDWLGGGEGGGR